MFPAIDRPVSLFTGARGPAPVSLVDGRQIDVGQQRRDDAALRSSRDRVAESAFDHYVRFQEGEDEPQDFGVLYAFPDPLHQHMMIYGVEAALDVALDRIAGQ